MGFLGGFFRVFWVGFLGGFFYHQPWNKAGGVQTLQGLQVGGLGGKQTIVINKSGGQTIRYTYWILPYVEEAPGNSVANSCQKFPA